MVRFAPITSCILSLIQTHLDELIPSKRSHIRNALVLLSFLAVILVGTRLIWVNTPFGVNTSHDSLFYFTTAENISSGRGLYWTGSGGELKPFTVFAPLYPLILASLSWISPSFDFSARAIAAVFFGLNIALVGLIIYAFTKRWLAGIIGSLLFMVSPVILKNHLGAMSEPLFFFTTFTSLAALALYINRPRRLTFVVIIICSALAFVSRYIGSAVLLTVFLSLLIFQRRPFLKKVREVFVFGTLASGPMVLYMIRNFLLTGATSNRTFRIHLIDMDRIRQFLDVIFSWITPNIQSHWLEIFTLAALSAFLLIYSWRQIRVHSEEKYGAPYLILILQLFAVSYVLLLVISLSFFDAHTRFDDRILSPIYIAILLAGLVAVGGMLKKVWHLILPVTLLILGLTGPLPYMVRQSNEMLLVMRNSGAGFSSLGWRNSQLVQWINSLDEDPIIITNQAMVVRYLTKIPAYQVPERFDPVKAEIRPDYMQQMQSIRAHLMEPNSFMALFERHDLSVPADDDITKGLELIFTATDGWVYVSKERGDSLPSP